MKNNFFSRIFTTRLKWIPKTPEGKCGMNGDGNDKCPPEITMKCVKFFVPGILHETDKQLNSHHASTRKKNQK